MVLGVFCVYFFRPFQESSVLTCNRQFFCGVDTLRGIFHFLFSIKRVYVWHLRHTSLSKLVFYSKIGMVIKWQKALWLLIEWVLRGQAKALCHALNQLNTGQYFSALNWGQKNRSVFLSIFSAQCCISVTLRALLFDTFRCRGPPFDSWYQKST